VVREERGLDAAEQDALSQWLAADPRRGDALRERRWAWREFDRIAGLPSTVAAAPDPDLLAPRSIRRGAGRAMARWGAFTLAAAAASVAGWLFWPAAAPQPARSTPVALSTALAAPCETRRLEDGSVVELNRGSRLTVAFTPEVRRVRLERGEAHFAVARDTARPFVVEAAGVTARAVGTAFNVRVGAAEVEIVVTEGRVEVGHDDRRADPRGTPILSARQRAVVPLDTPTSPPQVATLSETALATRLAWQPKLLDFSDVVLGEIVRELNRRNPVQLTVDSASLRALRVNASIRSDNVEGFVRLLESTFPLRAEWRSETEIALVPAR
jgi:transmembrane sensor